jgi:hypothetical protein
VKHRVLGDQRAQGVVGHDQPHIARLQADQALPDEILQGLLHDPELNRLLAIELGAELALQVGHGAIERVRQLIRRYFGAAHRRDRGVPTAAKEDVADAPDRERRHEQEHQGLDDPGAGILAQCIEHV